MKKLFILLITLIPFTAFSQKHPPCRSAIDLIFSPDYFAPPQLLADATFTPKTAFRFGANVNIFSTPVPYFVFRSGFRYVQYNMDIKSFFSTQVSHEKHEFVEIPLVFRYYLGLKTYRFYVEGQTSMNFNLTQSNEIDMHLTAGGAVGFEYSMTDNIAFFIQPTFRKPILRNLGLQSLKYHLSTGLEIGVKYRY